MLFKYDIKAAKEIHDLNGPIDRVWMNKNKIAAQVNFSYYEKHSVGSRERSTTLCCCRYNFCLMKNTQYQLKERHNITGNVKPELLQEHGKGKVVI